MEAEDLEQAERRLFRFQELECRLGLGSIWGYFRVKDKSQPPPPPPPPPPPEKPTPTAHSFVKDDSRGALVKSHDLKSTTFDMGGIRIQQQMLARCYES